MIPLFKVFMAPRTHKAIESMIYSGYIGEGPKVDEFEKAISNIIKNPRVVATNSGTTALTLALRLSGVGQGDKVISTPMTCLATNMPILSLGADIIWADIDPMTGNISPDSVENILDEHSDKVKAIMCVHWAGYPCEMNKLKTISKAYNVPIIEDAAHAFLSEYRNTKIGYEGDFVCFSFQAIKHLTCGDGGMLLTNNYDKYLEAQKMRWFQLDRSKGSSMRCYQDMDDWGYKGHMNDISATIGLSNLPYVHALIDHCRMNAERMRIAFKRLSMVKLLNYNDWNVSSYWLFSMLTDDPDDFIEYMKHKNIAASRVHIPNHDKTVFKRFARPLPGVEEFAKKQVCIPCGWWVNDKDLETIIEAVRSY